MNVDALCMQCVSATANSNYIRVVVLLVVQRDRRISISSHRPHVVTGNKAVGNRASAREGF
jgi:hypothetical protein